MTENQTIKQHLANPSVSIDAHCRERMISLGKVVESRKRLYLDVNFWIGLRDAGLGNNDAFEPTLSMLRSQVSAEKIVCPIAPSVFLELLKQNDIESRLATARLIDELSLGICLVPESQRIQQELCDFVCDALALQQRVPLEHLVWSKVSHLFGVLNPTQTGFDQASELAIQKAFFDHMWEISLVEFITKVGSDNQQRLQVEQSAENLNRLNSAHSHEVTSFERTYRSELIGQLELFCEDLGEMVLSIVKHAGGMNENTSESARSSAGQFVLYLIKRAIGNGDHISKTLRTSHIGALCHASIRGDKKHKLKGNDLHDFNHAKAGVGYCDAFFTDWPLHDRLSQSRFRLANEFDCVIGSDLKSLDAWVSSIAYS